MAKRILEPDAFIFMKVGDHAGEPFDAILERKNLEYSKTGRIFWGYGGAACHPIQQVQPFAKMHVEKRGSIYLLMEPIHSQADPEIVPASEFSPDGIHWECIPEGINVVGSKYALILGEIKPGDLDINPNNYEVGIGPSRGKSAQSYIQGRIDKACLRKRSRQVKAVSIEEPHKIKFSAELLKPYAILLR